MSGLSSRILLRLDNGEVVGSAHLLGREGAGGVVRLGIEEVSAAGRLRDRDFGRLSGFLSSVRGADAPHALPSAYPGSGYLNGKRPASVLGVSGFEAVCLASEPSRSCPLEVRSRAGSRLCLLLSTLKQKSLS
jgi:hypothetical protein